MFDPAESDRPAYGERVTGPGSVGPDGSVGPSGSFAPGSSIGPDGSITPPASSTVPVWPQPGPAGSLPPGAVPPEHVVRGLLLSLLVIPVGATLWVLLWNLGFIASIVAFAIAWGATWLYRRGSGGRITRASFWALLGVVVVAVAVCFLATLASDLVPEIGLPVLTALTTADFWAVYWDNVFNNPQLWASYAPDLLMSVLFAGIGCFGTFRALAREARS